MVCDAFTQADSYIHRLDPRVRLVIAAAFAVVVAMSSRSSVLIAALLLAATCVLLAKLPARRMLKRMAAVNAFMLMLVVLLPLSTPGDGIFVLGPLRFSREGFSNAVAIATRCNAIVFAFTALVSTVELPRLGHAFHHLHVPDKLNLVFLFTLRYIDLLHHEYQRLRRSMKARGFKPRADWHTYRSFGYLVGMLLVRSLERSERVLNAMKCRGYDGRFHLMSHFKAGSADLYFAAASTFTIMILGYIEWLV